MSMTKLYQRVGDQLLYEEAWVHAGTLTRHFGTCGETGHSEEVKLDAGEDEDEAIEQALSRARASGYAEIDEEDLAYVLVEYSVDGFGTGSEIEKRHELEDLLNEKLGWAGVGHVDGGSTGSGTMEVCCIVVDAAIAKRVIEKDLAGTEFANYSRIYEE